MTLTESQRGGVAALAAYLIWSTFPLYFNLLNDVPPVEVLCHRIFWGAAAGAVMILILKRGPAFTGVFSDKKRLAGLTASATMISINWGLYIWAVTNGHILDASVGYYINPLLSVLLGAVVLKEKLSPRQMAAVALAMSGVAVLAISRGGVPWVAVILPVTFGLYGLIRKVVPVDALTGFTIETILVAPLAFLFLITRPEGGALIAGGAMTTILLIVSGPVTAIPLILFAYGARRLKLATIGLMQYINPSIQMMFAVFLLGESFTSAHAITFSLIWAGLALYSVPLPRIGRKRS